MAMLAQGLPELQPAEDEEVTTFELLQPGDVFTFRPDWEIWLVAFGRPNIYDRKRGRYALQTIGHGLAFANEGCRVLVKVRR